MLHQRTKDIGLGRLFWSSFDRFLYSHCIDHIVFWAIIVGWNIRWDGYIHYWKQRAVLSISPKNHLRFCLGDWLDPIRTLLAPRFQDPARHCVFSQLGTAGTLLPSLARLSSQTFGVTLGSWSSAQVCPDCPYLISNSCIYLLLNTQLLLLVSWYPTTEVSLWIFGSCL